MISHKHASTLITAYNAFQEALEKNDETGWKIWSRIMLETQLECGFEFLKNDRLRFWMNYEDAA